MYYLLIWKNVIIISTRRSNFMLTKICGGPENGDLRQTERVVG